jgi:hypothetical protein
MSFEHYTILKILHMHRYNSMTFFSWAPFSGKQNICPVIFPKSPVSFRHSSSSCLTCTPPTPPHLLSHVYQHSLLGPLDFHPRLDGKSLHHLLLLLREGGLGAGADCGQRDGANSPDLIRVGVPHKQLVIHDA